MDESAEDMTAADIAPSPINETAGGTRYCKDMGSIIAASGGTFSTDVLLSTVSQSGESKHWV